MAAPWRPRPTVVVWLITSTPSGALTLAGSPTEEPRCYTNRDRGFIDGSGASQCGRRAQRLLVGYHQAAVLDRQGDAAIARLTERFVGAEISIESMATPALPTSPTTRG